MRLGLNTPTTAETTTCVLSEALSARRACRHVLTTGSVAKRIFGGAIQLHQARANDADRCFSTLQTGRQPGRRAQCGSTRILFRYSMK